MYIITLTLTKRLVVNVKPLTLITGDTRTGVADIV